MPPAPPADATPPAADAARAALARLAGEPDLPLPEALRRVCEAAAEGLGVARSGVWLFVNADRGLRCVNLFDRQSHKHTKGTLVTVRDFPGHLRPPGRLLACDDARTDPRAAELLDGYLAPHGVAALLAAPLWRDGRLVGAVCHEHAGDPRHWTAEEQEFARALADLVVERMKMAEGALTRPGAAWPAARPPSPSADGRPAAVLAHDLRDVLSGILADAALIARSSGVSADAAARAERIVEAVGRVELLIRERLSPGPGEVGR